MTQRKWKSLGERYSLHLDKALSLESPFNKTAIHEVAIPFLLHFFSLQIKLQIGVFSVNLNFRSCKRVGGWERTLSWTVCPLGIQILLGYQVPLSFIESNRGDKKPMTGVASVTKLFWFKNFTLLYFTWHIRDFYYCIPWHLTVKKNFFLMSKNYLIPSNSGYERVKALEECKTSSWSSVPLSSVSVPCLNGASQWLYLYDCSILRKYWNTWSKQFSCGSWSWICSVLKFIPLVDFG